MLFRLRRFFDVRTGEGLPVLLSFLYVGCVVAAFLLAKPLRNSLYLSEYGPYALVHAYVAVPIVLSVFVPIYAAVAGRVGTRRATFGTLVFFSLNAVWFWWAFRVGGFDQLPLAFYVWVNCFGVVAPVQAWSFASSLFDSRQARRLFGVIGAGASLGAIAGGVLARFLVVPVGGTINLLLVLAALILAAAVIVAVASQRLRRRHPSQVRRPPRRPFRETLGTIAGSRYLRLLTALVVVVAVVTQWLAFQLSLVASARFGDDADALTRFFGEFNFTLGALALVLQLLVTAKALRVFGVGAAILFLPAALAFGSALTVLLPVFTAVLLTNAVDQSLRFSVDKAAYELLYLPLAPRERPAIKNALDILANRMGDAVGGIVLGLMTGGFFLLPGAGFGLRGTAAITCGLVVVWGAVAWRLRSAYVGAIGDSIHRHRIDVEHTLILEGTSSQEVSASTLLSGDVDVVRSGLAAWRCVDAPRGCTALYPLLSHEAADVRRDALAVLAECGDRSVATVAQTMLRDPVRSVRTQALVYLAYDGTFDPLSHDLPLDEFDDFSVRVAIAAGLATPGRGRNQEAARLLLEQMAGSPESADRAHAGRLLVLLDEPPAHLVALLVGDPDPDVARQGIRAARARQVTESVEHLLAALARTEVAAEAAAALAAIGHAVVPRLEAALTDTAVPIDARRAIPSVLLRIGTPEADRALVAGLLDGDVPLRHRVIASLNKVQQRNPQMEVDRALLDLLLAAEIAGHSRAYQVLMTLRHDDAVASALRQSMELELERMFRLIALMSPAGALHDAYVGIRSDNETVRANALEYLDNVLRPEWRELLVPLVDPNVTDAERAVLVERMLGVPQASADEAMAMLHAFHHMPAAPAGADVHASVPAGIHGGEGAG